MTRDEYRAMTQSALGMGLCIFHRVAIVVLFMCATGCSIKKMAVNKLGNALAGSGTTFSSDNDPELIASAAPFSLKLMESLLAESPNHRELLLAASSGFTQYAYLAVQEPADEAESHDIEGATALRKRARLLYLRARDYGLRGLEIRHKDFGASLRREPRSAVEVCDRRDVAFLYWTAAAWGDRGHFRFPRKVAGVDCGPDDRDGTP